MDAVVTALQDRLYMIDDVDSELNIIMASRSTEKKLANTVLEADENEMPFWLKISGITIIIAISITKTISICITSITFIHTCTINSARV